MSAHDTESTTFGPDTRAAFMGLILGAIVIFGIMRTIVGITNAKYNNEKPAAEATK
ncbi:MAG: hypothetical protein JWM41_3623 [Gemmatimonadetes bacterium]|jgi:hypothetical protein|nr:hypothetical protein [Gemmatimonadota bacterium]